MEDLNNRVNSLIDIEKKNADAKYVKFKIGLIFDDPPKITSLISAVHMEENSNYSLLPIELPLLETEDDMVRSIIDLDIDAVIIDADLAALYTGVNLAAPYSGVSLARRLTSIPVFLLTIYPEEWKKTKGYEVFELGKYLENPSGLNAKIIEKCKKISLAIRNLKLVLKHILKSKKV